MPPPSPSLYGTFYNMLVRGIKTGQAKDRAKAAIKFIRDAARASRMTTPMVMNQNRSRMKNNEQIGSMYLFVYDPKHKKTLPYYDTYPLIFVINKYDDGFLGINFHYLPPALRARLMDSLYELQNNTKLNPQTRLKVSYQILKSAARYKYFKPTVKRYLYSHVRSRFMLIRPIEWDMTLFLPLARFKKAPIMKVWKDSRAMIGGL